MPTPYSRSMLAPYYDYDYFYYSFYAAAWAEPKLVRPPYKKNCLLFLERDFTARIKPGGFLGRSQTKT